MICSGNPYSSVVMDKQDIARITQSATDACTEYLRSALMDGQYAEGESIIIDRLASQLGVSQTPIREAVRRLEAEGFLTFIPKKGAIVRPIDQNEFEELVEIRKALEPVVLRKSIEKASQAETKAAKRELKRWKKQVDPTAILGSQWRFYSAIYTPAKQPRLLELIAANWKHIHRYHRVTWIPSNDARNKDIALMSDLFDKYESKEITAAVEALLDVISWGASIVRRSLEKNR